MHLHRSREEILEKIKEVATFVTQDGRFSSISLDTSIADMRLDDFDYIEVVMRLEDGLLVTIDEKKVLPQTKLSDFISLMEPVAIT